MEPPIILCGLGRVGRRVLEYLQTAGLPVVVVDLHGDARGRCPPEIRYVAGDCRRQEVLEEAGVRQARGVLLLTSDDLVNISAALMVRHLNAEVRVVMRMFNQSLIPRLGKAIRNVFGLSTSALPAPLFALTALTGQALGAFRVEGLADGRRQVAELTVSEQMPLEGQTVCEVAARRAAVVLAHVPAGGAARFLREVDTDVPLRRGDRLVVCGQPHRVAPLLRPAEDDGSPPVLWAGFVRRHARVVGQTLLEVDLAVKLCGGVLGVVLLVSTLVFHFGIERQTVGAALFRSVSLMATGADMHGEELQSDGLRVFVAGLRIVGAVLMAAFTAIVTNYLLRARLGGALEIRRIPDSGHVILCGLGNIGFRVLEELLGYGERVVVIEINGDGRFVATARRLGVPVLVGDATVAEVLRQAHADKARAVIAATDNELANLEVALLVREMSPEQRVVLRVSDPNLAQTLREAADVRLALSVSALAAPAFVAALYGDRVQSVFLVEGRLLAVVDVLIQPQDTSLAGKSARAVAVDYRLVPVAVVPAQGGEARPTAHGRLQPGDRLVVIIAMSDLQSLLRREPVPRGWAVDVEEFPLPARPFVVQLLRVRGALTAEAAEQVLERLPACVGTDLTRGEAEDLQALLQRERVRALVRRDFV